MIHERVLRDILTQVQNLESRVTNLELLEMQHTLLHDLILREDSPTLEFQETDQTLPSGRWRIRLDGDLLRIERNTSGAGNFSTLDSKMVLGATGVGINLTSAPSYELEVLGKVQATQFISSAATGTQPLLVNSTTKVTNLNADMLDGYHESDFAKLADNETVTGAWNFSSRIFINDTANSKMTIGLTINQGANDDEILTLKSSDVTHLHSNFTETDTYFLIKKKDPVAGGALLAGLAEGGWQAVMIYGLNDWLDTTKGTDALSCVQLWGFEDDGAGGIGNSPGNGNVVSIGTQRNGNREVIAIFDTEGDLHLDATLTQNAWDDHDDLVLLHGLRASLVPELQERFGHFIEEARPILEATGVITYNDDGHHFIAMKKLSMLLCDALRQLGERYRKLERKIMQYEQVLLELGVDPKMLKGAQDAE